MDPRDLFHASGQQRLSGTTRALLLVAATSLESHILFRKLPPAVQTHVGRRVQRMALDGQAVTLFDTELVVQNPPPPEVTNPWKWRATRPVLRTLRVPRFALECDLVWVAYTTRDLSLVDVCDLVRTLRVYAGVDNLISFVGEKGVDALSAIIQNTLPRIS